jgi:TetR/AcrR family transcriptional regulator, mexJK operon transcriptional repressor
MTEPGPGRSARKRAAIVEAATRVFLERGYVGTSMDQVATAAAVSKQTVYKHFADKKTLFDHVMRATSEPMHAAVHEAVGSTGTGNLETDLRAYGEALLAQVVAPDVVRLRRIILAEADRFPDLAAGWHAQGPAKTVDDLAVRLGAALDLPDPHRAAEHLMWLLIADPLVRSMFVPGATLTRTEITRRADAAVTAFLAAYARAGSGSRPRPGRRTARPSGP